MAVSVPKSLLRFGLFELDTRAGQLRKNGARVRVAQQPLQVLALLLERPGDVVTREELRNRLWAEDVFVDFDHGLNKSVQKLRDALGDLADSPRYIETIPRVGYRFLAPVIAVETQFGEDAASVAGAGASAGEFPASETSPKSANREWFRRKTLWWVTAAGVVVLLAAGAGVVHRRQLRGVRIQSVAVLPLDNLSGDKGQDYFAAGMTDELTTTLAKDSTLQVVSRTSAMQLKGLDKPVPEIARELGVEGVVEGSVARSGSNVHMKLELIEVSSGRRLWADSYDRDAADAISLPDEAALAIAKITNSAAAERQAARYVKPAAHDAYLRGRYLWFGGRNDEAEKYFQKAVQLQPDYALAWSGVSDYYMGGIAGGEMDPRKASGPGMAAAKKALELDGSSAEVLNSECAALYFGKWDLAGANRECESATEHDPEFAEAYHLRAKVLMAMDRPAEAIASQKKAMELDPFARPWGLAYIYMLARRYDAAITEARQRLESTPGDRWTLFSLADAYRRKGAYGEYAKTLEEALIANGEAADAAAVQRAFARGGFRAVVLWNIASMTKKARTHYVSPSDLAVQYALLGNGEKAMSLLEEAYRQHSGMLLESLQTEPAFDFLHKDPRYRALVKEIGLPPAY